MTLWKPFAMYEFGIVFLAALALTTAAARCARGALRQAQARMSRELRAVMRASGMRYARC